MTWRIGIGNCGKSPAAGQKVTQKHLKHRRCKTIGEGFGFGVGANYIEANEALSKKDSRMRIKVCRKEAKESWYWLDLLDQGNSQDPEEHRRKLIQEARELTNIFGAILRNSK